MNENKILKRFDAKTEVKIIKGLSKILKQADETYSEEQAINKEVFCTLDPSNCLMISAKTEESKRCLSRFVNKVDKESEKESFKIPELIYNDNTKESTSKYSIIFLKEIINLFYQFTDEKIESVKISVKKDYPMSLENEHFLIIIAPRVDND